MSRAKPDVAISSYVVKFAYRNRFVNEEIAHLHCTERSAAQVSAHSFNSFCLSLHRLEVSAKKLAAGSGTTTGNEREISAKKK